jgi:chemotaxis protein MotB
VPKNEKSMIIIKKVNKGGHGGHHGGSWKVAYADFVTAMMAFFLLMWLISAASQQQKEHLAGYFKEYTLFDWKGTSDVPGTSQIAPPEHQSATVGDSPTSSMTGPGDAPLSKEPMEEIPLSDMRETLTSEQLVSVLTQRIEKKLEELKDQITIEVFDKGVRIEARHKEGQPLFPSGSSTPTAVGQKILSEIGLGIKDLKDKIAIEGHTDAVKYSGDKYTNWELSTDRASMARRVLQQNGVNVDRIQRVSGCASSKPLNQSDPYDPKNRRISILLYNENAKITE